MQPLTNTLFIGFSVTEMGSSYIPRLRSLVDRQDVEITIDHCGIGGITPEGLVYFVDRIIKSRPECQRVVFEVATSYVRDVYKGHLAHHSDYYKQIWAHFEQLISVSRWLGKDVAFVNLPRADIDYRDDPLESIISQVCAMHWVPLLSVSYQLHTDGIDLGSILLDEVHPQPVGAVLYAEKILNFLVKLGAAKCRAPQTERLTRFGNVAIAERTHGETEVFQRHGFREHYAIIHGGDSITIELEEERSLEGFSVLCGPKSGILTIETETVQDFVCYDGFCYYERMMTATQLLGRSRRATFRLSTEVLDIPLIKGVKDEGPRRMGLFYLFSNNLS